MQVMARPSPDRGSGTSGVGAGAVRPEVIRWPEESAQRSAAAAADRPRLLLVDPDSPPPNCDDPLEDWVRLPVSDADLTARLVGLERRSALLAADLPTIDADGVVRNGGTWVSLPPVEARIAAALIDRFGAVVQRDVLSLAGWPEGAPGRNALDVHVLRLRRRLSAVGLVIRTIRSRGYLLERDGPRARESETSPQ